MMTGVLGVLAMGGNNMGSSVDHCTIAKVSNYSLTTIIVSFKLILILVLLINAIGNSTFSIIFLLRA